MKAILIQTTCIDENEANNIAKILIEKKLAACIHIYPIKSHYFWDDKVCNDNEFILNIKTRKSNFKSISKEILKNHSYEVPEIISFEINNISKKYKKFIMKNSKFNKK